MINRIDLPSALTLVAALGCGLMAGVFFAFSTFVMRALARLTPAQGIAAMQAINIAAITPLFLLGFLGTAASCALAMIATVLRWPGSGGVYLLGGGAAYLVGTVGVTAARNVPMNNALATIAPTDPDSADRWAGYLANWTAWNHVRTAAALVAAVLLAAALISRAAQR